MQELVFVDYVENLSKENQDMIKNAQVKYLIPWRAVWNENSLTTPCRLTFDASASPRGDCNLNSLLAKGTNTMNNLLHILIHWT